MKFLVVFACLLVACAAHRPSHLRRHAATRRVNDATRVLISRLAHDVRVLEGKGAGRAAAAKAAFNEFLATNFKTSDGQDIDWTKSKLLFKSKPKEDCPGFVDDVYYRRWLFLDQPANEAQYSTSGLKFVGDKANIRKVALPEGVSPADAASIGIQHLTLSELGESEEVPNIYQMDYVLYSEHILGVVLDGEVKYKGRNGDDAACVMLLSKNDANEVQPYLWGKMKDGRLGQAFSQMDDFSVDFPSKFSSKFLREQARPSDSDASEHVPDGIVLLDAAKDMRKFKYQSNRKLFKTMNRNAQRLTGQVCCLCSREDANFAGFGDAAQRAVFCKLMLSYGGAFPEAAHESCGVPSPLTADDVNQLQALAGVWGPLKEANSDLQDLSALLDEVKDKTPEEIAEWITTNAWK